MAFINEKLSIEQRSKFVSRAIKNPVSNKEIIPLYHTIDEERNMCLWQIGNMGRDDFEHQIFLFDWKGKEYFIIMKYSNPSVGNIAWSVSSYQKEDFSNEKFIKDFTDALEVYAVNGRPDQQGIIGIKVEI